MQTFLPYDDFVASAAVLDDKRLGKQRVETYQILPASAVTGAAGAGLVVLDRVDRAAVPALGVPVLTLTPSPDGPGE